MVKNNSSIHLVKVFAATFLARLAQCSLTDLIQFMVEVTLMSNVLSVFATLCLIFYIKFTCPYLTSNDSTRPRTFHSARYQIVPYSPKAKQDRAPE